MKPPELLLPIPRMIATTATKTGGGDAPGCLSCREKPSSARAFASRSAGSVAAMTGTTATAGGDSDGKEEVWREVRTGGNIY